MHTQWIEQLRALKLTGMAAALSLQWEQPTTYADLSFEERIGILRNITIQSDGNVSPCCGLVDRGLRVFYGSIHEKPLPELLRKANSSTLYNWLALEGPEGLKSAIESKAPHEPFLGRYLQNCQLCQEIFSSKKKMETLLERMPVKAKALSKNRLEHEVLRSAYKEAK